MKSNLLLASALFLLVAASTASAQTVTVVNLIPKTNSNEANDDREPNIAVNPANPLQIAATAFTPDSSGATNLVPIFLSQDGGQTWTESSIIPVNANNTCPGTCDITLRFAGASNILYVGWLDGDISVFPVTIEYSVGRATPFPTPPASVTVLENIPESTTVRDQPYTQATTVMGDPAGGTGNDRVYIGSNDASKDPKGATLDQSLNVATAAPPAGLSADLLEVRTTCGFDGPPIRPAMHPDGTVYALFSSWTACSVPSTSSTADTVLRRDDSWGRNGYSALLDSGDSKAGVKVASGISIPFDPHPGVGYADLGSERIGSMLSIALDPRNSQIVYTAWGTGVDGTHYSLNIARSGSGGASGSWTNVLTINNATNPALAVNIRGVVGVLYQQLVTPGTCNGKGTATACWETHLQTSSNFGNNWSDLTLGNLPDLIASPGEQPTIGDYDHLQAIGKDFYGIFSGYNAYATSTTTNFPQGVTFQRFTDNAGKYFADAAHTTAVGNSVDPFFFHVTEEAAGDDFYVRDWTDSPTSGDNGAEPSTHPVFYATSDVWNRRGTLDGSPFPNDQPANEDTGNGSGTVGDNWAFARIRRNSGGAAATVTAHFLVSKFGTGSNFEDNGSIDPDVALDPGDPAVSFTAGDVGPHITPAYHWHLASIAGNHLCLAVEITGPNDPFIPPSLVGQAPGWTTGTDTRIVDDNNKAQRNMGLTTTPARGAGMFPTFCAIVHNAALAPRDINLRYEVPVETLRRLKTISVQPVGSGGKESFAAREPTGNLSLNNVLPGENRWVCTNFAAPAGKPGEYFPINFTEYQDNLPVNGFTIGPRLAEMPDVVRASIELHRSAFTRLAAIYKMEVAKDEAAQAEKLLREQIISEVTYMDFLKAHLKPVEVAVNDLIKIQHGSDPFGDQAAYSQLAAAVASGKVEDASVTHASLMNKLDSNITMIQLEKGDPADVLQMVRWQMQLYSTVPALKGLHSAAFILKESQEFIDDFGKRKRHADSYPELIHELLKSFHETAEALEKIGVKTAAEVDQMEDHLKSVEALENAHRDFLAKLQANLPK
jgi:hypothetical protein